jgi:hypothetical protein
MGDRYGGGGKGAVSDGLIENLECGLKNLVLMLGGCEQGRPSFWCGLGQRRCSFLGAY